MKKNRKRPNIKIGTVSINFNWQQALSYMFLILERGDLGAKVVVKTEFQKMAKAADLYNEMLEKKK